jgi:acetyltransferase
VRLDVRDATEAEEAFARLAGLPAATGVLVQETVAGPEVIIGAAPATRFGRLIIFGLGGVAVEVLREVAFALAPLGPEEALEVIRGTRLVPLLKGARGRPGLSVSRLADWTARLSLLAHHFPDIREIDLNPVMGTGDRLRVVDARIVLGPDPGSSMLDPR